MSNADLDRVAFLKDLRKKVYRFQTLSEIVELDDDRKIPLIKGVMNWGETSAWIAPPGGMKSALLASAAVCVAAGRDWHGKRVKYSAGVIYFALERADLVRRRLVAQATRMGIDPASLNIMVVSEMIDLMNPEAAKRIIDLTEASLHIFPYPPGEGALGTGLVIIDTFAKGIAAGGGDEDKAKDQGRVFANLQRIKNESQAHIAIIGHTGKDETRGSRGSNAIVGDVDVMVTISGDAIKTATVIKANDAPEGPLFSFKSEVFEFGTDEDGDPITVNIVSGELIEGVAATAKPPRLSPADTIALEALAEVANETAPAAFGLPAGVRVANVEAWKDELRRRGALDPKHSNPTVQFKRLWEKLAGHHLIGRRDNFVWRA